MPFELRALECALDSAVQLLSGEVAVLEREAYPVIDALAAQARHGLQDFTVAASGCITELSLLFF